MLGIIGLFWLDRDQKTRTSKALWIPGIWLWILSSRELSLWLATFGMGSGISSELEGNPLDRNLYMSLLLVGLIVLAQRWEKVGRLLKANLPLLLFFLYCAASVLWSDYPMVSLKRWIKAVGDVVMVMIVLTDDDPLGAMKRILARTSFLAIPLSVLVIKYYPDIGVHYILEEGKRVATGVTIDKNALGAVCMLFGLGAVWRLLGAYRERENPHWVRHQLVQFVVLAMAMWLFAKANSMTALLCFCLTAGLLAVTSISTRARTRSVVTLLVVAAFVVAAMPLFLGVGSGLLKTVGRDATLTGRTGIWKEALAVENNPLLGKGFESFWLSSPLDGPERWWHVNSAHNGYLEVYLNLGWLGVFLIIAVIVSGYRNVTAMIVKEPAIGVLWLAYFVVELIYSLTEAGFRMMNLIWIFFLLASAGLPGRALLPSRLKFASTAGGEPLGRSPTSLRAGPAVRTGRLSMHRQQPSRMARGPQRGRAAPR